MAGRSRGVSRAVFFLIGIHAPLQHVMPEHKIYDSPAIRHLIFSAGTGYPSSATRGHLQGTEQPEIVHHSPDLTVVTSQAERLLYPAASAVIKVYDDLSDGQLLIDQAIW